MVEGKIIYQLILAIFLGSLIGLEREAKERAAGLQTYSLVALGSCLFTIIASQMISFFSEKYGMVFDPTRIIHAIVVGIGFVGGGVIFQKYSGVVGLTTAAGLWVAAAIGIAIGIEQYFLATFSTFLALLILAGFGWLERKAFKKD
jgi:putative Mg2+ transporter-C (MgtC) family protein